MKKFKEYLDMVGYDNTNTYPEIKYIWYAYTNGEVFKCDTSTEARKISPHHVEQVQDKESKKIFDEYCETQRQLWAKAHDLWYNDLVEWYSPIDKRVIDLAYSYAYDRSHSSGVDDVYNAMGEYIEFYEKICNIKE